MTETQAEVIIQLLKQIVENTTKQKKPKKEKVTIPLLEQLAPFINQYAPSMITDFNLYWDENERWKLEKTWDIEKRLKRWKRQEEKWQHEKEARKLLKQVDEKPVDLTHERRDEWQPPI